MIDIGFEPTIPDLSSHDWRVLQCQQTALQLELAAVEALGLTEN